MTESTKIALVMGSGAARGYAHLGALKRLFEAGISVDMMVGTSFGALVGAAFSAGRSVYDMEELTREFGWRKIIKMLDIGYPRGIIAGNRMKDFFSFVVKEKLFSELDIPLTVVTTNIETGEEVLINEGPVSEAVMASSALPGIFTPVRFKNQWLVDGALVNPLPIQTALDLGADLVIAIDVSCPIKSVKYLNGIKKSSKALFKNISQLPYVNSMVSPKGISRKLKYIIPEGFYTASDGLRIRENNKEKIDMIPKLKNVVLIKPEVEEINWFDFYSVNKIIQKGSKAVNPDILRNIKALISELEEKNYAEK